MSLDEEYLCTIIVVSFQQQLPFNSSRLYYTRRKIFFRYIKYRKSHFTITKQMAMTRIFQGSPTHCANHLKKPLVVYSQSIKRPDIYINMEFIPITLKKNAHFLYPNTSMI